MSCRRFTVTLISFSLASALFSPVLAESSKDKQKKTECAECMTRQQGDAILEELKQIRLLLEKQQAPEPAGAAGVSLKIAPDSAVQGSKDAPLTLVEFSDYQCVFCQRFHTDALPQLKKNYIDTGKVRFYSRDLPLNFHANAFKAAVAARCAGEQGKFWDLRDLMVANANNLSDDSIVKFAQGVKVDLAPFRACLASKKYDESIRGDTAEAARIGVQGTPSFVLGKSTPEGVRGVVIEGALPFGAFEEQIKKLGVQ
jgi:protein-disulfide isomerase